MTVKEEKWRFVEEAAASAAGSRFSRRVKPSDPHTVEALQCVIA